MFTIGADIEVFGKRNNGEHVALCGKIGGSKDKPRQLPDLPEGYMVQEDNVSLEYNIPPCTTEQTFVKAIATMRGQCQIILRNLELELSEEASFSFHIDQLRTPQAQMFGCEPDYNVWTRQENEKPEARDKNLRTCGGHIHVGSNEVDMVLGATAMELFLGVPSVVLDNTESGRRRRELYGKSGAMRPKPYGWEYRVLSNFWMFSDELVRWVYRNTLNSLHFNHKKMTAALAKEIQRCINSGDEKLATKLIEDLNIKLPKDYKEEGEQEIPFSRNGVGPKIGGAVWVPLFARAQQNEE